MKHTTGGEDLQVRDDDYVGMGWLVFSLVLFTLVFLPVILL